GWIEIRGSVARGFAKNCDVGADEWHTNAGGLEDWVAKALFERRQQDRVGHCHELAHRAAARWPAQDIGGDRHLAGVVGACLLALEALQEHRGPGRLVRRRCAAYKNDGAPDALI